MSEEDLPEWEYVLRMEVRGLVWAPNNIEALTAAIDKESKRLRLPRHVWVDTHAWKMPRRPPEQPLQPEPVDHGDAYGDPVAEEDPITGMRPDELGTVDE